MEKAAVDANLRRKRRHKNLALAIVLGVLVALFYVITIVRMGGS